MIKNINIRNFRRHKDSKIPLERDVTVFVGENDTGKSSLLDALQIILKGNAIRESDFLDKASELLIEIETQSEVYSVTGKISEGKIEESRIVKFSAKDIIRFRDNLDSKSEDEIRDFARSLGIKITTVMKLNTIKQKISEFINEKSRFSRGKFLSDSTKTPTLPVYFLSGIEFESVEKFIHEAFFKNRQKSVWDSEIDTTNGKISIFEAVSEKLENYKPEVEQEIKDSGVLDIIKSYINTVDSIEVEPHFDRKDININLTVQLKDVNGVIQNSSGFGDGTRRRLTIALLQHKAKKGGEQALYLFDEPDTHLHVRAQNDLLNALDAISKAQNQVIVTTHSPFVMNAVDLRQIRLLSQYENITSIRGTVAIEEDRSKELMAIGIENIHLFFSRKFLIVEGETEESFFPIAYRKIVGRPASRDFIKIINVKGIENIPRFADMFSQFANPEDIYILTDNDGLTKAEELISALKIPNIFRVGRKEFEDAFLPQIVYEAWKTHVLGQGVDIGPDWTSDSLDEIYLDSDKIISGISKHIPVKNSRCSVALNKVSLGRALGEYCQLHQLPEEVQTLIRVLSSPSREEYGTDLLSPAKSPLNSDV